MTFKCQRVFWVSLGLNLVLAGLLLLKGSLASHNNTSTENQTIGMTGAERAKPRIRETRPTTPWQQLYSTNFHEFVGSLRLAGCPEPVIRNLIAGAINRQFEGLMESSRRIDDFWLDGEEKKAEEHLRAKTLVGLERQRQTLIWELLQIPWYQDPWLANSTEMTAYFGSFLSAEKAQRLGELFVQGQFDAAATQALSGVELDSPAGLELARELVARSNAQLAEALSPAEIEELGIRLFMVDYFDVWKEQRRFGEKLNGTELREVLRILKPDHVVFFDTPEALKYVQPEHQRRIDRGNALRAVLGDRRFAVFLQRHNGDFEQMPGHSDEGRPGPEVYLGMFELQQSVAAQIDAARHDEALAGPERDALVANLVESARQTARSAMNADAYRVYLKGGGRWLDSEGGSDAK